MQMILLMLNNILSELLTAIFLNIAFPPTVKAEIIAETIIVIKVRLILIIH